jgi:hypothetical protein
MEDTIAGLIPNEYVAKRDQVSKGSLLSCSKDSYQWSGRTFVHLQGSPNVDQILDRIATHWKGDPDYTIDRKPAADGTPSIAFSGAHGSVYLVGPTLNQEQVQIMSFSPCFRLAEDADPGGTF